MIQPQTETYFSPVADSEPKTYRSTSSKKQENAAPFEAVIQAEQQIVSTETDSSVERLQNSDAGLEKENGSLSGRYGRLSLSRNKTKLTSYDNEPVRNKHNFVDHGRLRSRQRGIAEAPSPPLTTQAGDTQAGDTPLSALAGASDVKSSDAPYGDSPTRSTETPKPMMSVASGPPHAFGVAQNSNARESAPQNSTGEFQALQSRPASDPSAAGGDLTGKSQSFVPGVRSSDPPRSANSTGRTRSDSSQTNFRQTIDPSVETTREGAEPVESSSMVDQLLDRQPNSAFRKAGIWPSSGAGNSRGENKFALENPHVDLPNAPALSTSAGESVDGALAPSSGEGTPGSLSAGGSSIEAGTDGPANAELARDIVIQLRQSVERNLHPIRQQELHSLTIQIHPEELGSLEIQVEHSGNHIQARIIASEMSTSDLLARSRQSLIESLADAGLQLTDLDISFGNESANGRQDAQRQVEFDFISPHRGGTSHSTTIQPQHRDGAEHFRNGAINLLV